MTACIIIVGIALAWLLWETDWLRVNLMSTRKPWLMLPAPAVKAKFTTPEVLITPYTSGAYYVWWSTVAQLREQLKELSKVELKLVGEAWEYDYSDQT